MFYKVIRNQRQKLIRIATGERHTLGVCSRINGPTGFESMTLGLEMRGFVVTNSTKLSRFVTLQ